MGTAFSPNYANIHMGYFEQTALSKAPSNLQPLIWKRFIDDIFSSGHTGNRHCKSSAITLTQSTHQSNLKSVIQIRKSILETTVFFKHGTKLGSTLFVNQLTLVPFYMPHPSTQTVVNQLSSITKHLDIVGSLLTMLN